MLVEGKLELNEEDLLWKLDFGGVRKKF